MDRQHPLLVVIGGAVLLLLLLANLTFELAFEFSFASTTAEQPPTRLQAAKLIEAANYCEAASDCAWIRGGDWSANECRMGNILVNRREVPRMPLLCDMATSPRLFFVHSEAPLGIDMPQCVAGKCRTQGCSERPGVC